MFQNLFQVVKEIGAVGPPVQDGTLIDNNQNGNERKLSIDEDEYITEEGFVAVGKRSSFIFATNKYSNSFSSMENNSNISIYPSIPPVLSSSAIGQTTSIYSYSGGNSYSFGSNHTHQSPEPNGMIREVPFVLHPVLKQHVNEASSKLLHSYSRNSSNLTSIENYNYDFDFERRVLRDIQQQFKRNK